MKKRIISFVLALCMLISFIPAATANVEETKTEYTYYFSREAIKQSANVSYATYLANGYSYDTVVKGEPWELVGLRSANSNGLSSGVFYFQTKIANKDFPNAGFVFKIKVKEAGKYSPYLTYTKRETSPNVNVFIVPADNLSGYDLTTSAGIRDAANKVKTSSLGILDFYAPSAVDETTEKGELSSVKLESGDYYLMFIINDINENTVATSGTAQYRIDVKSLTLAQENEYQYITAKSAIKPELISDRNILETADFFTEYGGVDTSVSDDWAFSSYPVYSTVDSFINTNPINISAYNTASQPYLALKLNVGGTGKFDVNVHTYGRNFGTKATVYMLPVGNIAKVKRTDFEGLTPIGEIDTNIDSTASVSMGYTFVGKTKIESKGDYYIVFDFNSDNPNQQSSSTARHCFYLAGIKLTESTAEDEAESLALKANKTIIDIGDEETLSATATYSLSGTKIMTEGVTYVSDDLSVVEVSSDGVVTAKGEGSATVTATIDGTTISDSVVFTVLAADPGNAGKVFEYVFSTNSMLDQTVYGNPRLDSGGTLRQMSDIDSYDEINPEKTALWTYAAFTGANVNLGRANFNANFESTKYGTSSQGFLAIKLNIPNKGEYNLFADHVYSSFGTAADVYLLSAESVSKITRDTFKNMDPIGHFDTRKTETSPESGEQKVAKVNISKRGDYYVVLDCNSDNPVYQGTTTRHYLYLNAIKLYACSGEFDKVEIALDGMESDEHMVLATAKKINTILTDATGMPLDEVDQGKLSVKLTSNDNDIITINESGYAEAVSCGTAKIIADVTYGDISRNAEYEVTVDKVGKNLLADNNPSFETDEWVWNWTREDVEPAEAKFMRTMLGTAPTAENPNNRAMGVVFNPNVAAIKNPGDIALKTGKRIKIEPGKFYQLSFKYKLENYKIPEDASNMSMYFNLYAYPSQTSGTAVSTFTRTTNVARNDYIEKYSDWKEVVVAISAPNEFINPVYVTPRLVFRPTADDLEKTGFEGIAWFDDFELREVGFADVKVEVLGDMTTGNKTDHTVYAIPYSTTGHVLSLDDAAIPECATFETSDAYVISNPKKYERKQYGDESGNYVVSAYSTLGGMNGSAEISASITLGAITRKGSTLVKASNFPVRLYRVEGTADNISVGESTKIKTTSYLTDGSVVDLSNAIWEYKSLTPEIISVSSNGTVTALRAGKGKVNISVLNGSVGAETVCEVTVTDSSVFESVTLSGPETVAYLRDAKLSLSGTMSSGCAADTDSADVVWHITSDPTGGITVSDSGVLFGEIKGATAEIYADVTINGTTLATNTINVTVGESTLLDFIVDFGETKETVPADVKIETDGWEFNKAESHSSAFNAILRSDGVLSQTNGVGRALAVDVNVPYSGIYNIIFTGEYYISGAEKSDIYVDGVYAGEYEFYNNGANRKGTPKSLRTLKLDAGVHTFAFVPRGQKVYSKSYNQIIVQLRFAGVETLPELESLSVSESVTVSMSDVGSVGAKITLDDGFVYSGELTKSGETDAELLITYSGYDSSVAQVENDGTITPVSVGETEVKVIASVRGKTIEKNMTIVVVPEDFDVDNDVASVKIAADRFVMSTNTDGIELNAIGFNAVGKELSIDDAVITWHSSDDSIVKVSENGVATPVSVGVADITLTVSLAGFEFSDTRTISIRDGKISRTYYTDEMVEAAAENSEKYTWASNIKKSAIKKAEKYIGLEETLWNMVTAENIPRAITVGLEGDPERWLCRYCGENLQLYGNYPWSMNPLARPWKVQCGSCKRYFPSNDFAKLYELGKNEHGVYEVELAKERNAALVEETNGEVNYLKNILYPELAGFKSNFSEWENIETWGVEDGLGYDTGRVYSNGIAEMHTYIAYYNHFGLWYATSENRGILQTAANALAEAYIHTGEAKYGRVGAILIDRIADVYPDYDGNQWAKYTSNEDSSDVGKILGRIWECMLVEDFAIAYDAFFPMYDDPQVVSFLAEKAKKYNFDNDKSTPEKIRSNIEKGLLREIGKAAGEGRVCGNFGMHQSAVTTAAVVLDTQPYTNEMIDWVFNNSVGATKNYQPGGDISKKLINDVSRDGQGSESGAGYNSYWVTDIVEVAYTLGRYDGYDGLDFWNHPKYIQMIKSWAPLTLTKRGLPSIGDSGTYADFRVMLNNPELMLTAYAETGDIEIAQHLYNVEMYLNGTIDNLHYNIYTKNPEDIRKEIKNVIETYGEYDYSKSSILTGYGFAALRDGYAYKNVGTSGINDTMRDFWIYFGGATSHKHNDMMNIGVEAYGICLTPDLGYPEATGTDPNRYQWQNNTLSHNAVLVNEEVQLPATEPGKPLHYEQKDTRVKVIDVSAPEVYTATDEYRRSVVMIDYDDEVSYGIDFFNVRGGNDHLYSFHASSNTVSSYSDNLDFYVQPGGTYAGVSVPYGPDPYTNESSTAAKLKYPTGYTWLENVRRADNPGVSDFYIDWEIKDIQNRSRNSGEMDIHLRLTMVNDFNADEVTLATGLPPRSAANLSKISHLEYMLVRRKGSNLNTLFTTVLEPYNSTRYIKSIEALPVSVVLGTPGKHDLVKAVKVTMNNGRVDYVVYAQNKNIVYNIADKFEFSGFVGVYSENADGENIYSYLNDGTKLGEFEKDFSAYTGEIVDFQKELSFDNWIDVRFDRNLSDEELDNLSDRMINVEYSGLGNAAYVIESAERIAENNVRLSIGNITLIDKFVDMTNEDLGYVYDVAEGKKFEIPMSYEVDEAPVFEKSYDDIKATAGSNISVKVSAESSVGNLVYSARQLPRGATFDEQTATITWKPASNQIGENLVAIDASDENGRTSTLYFTIEVYGSTTGTIGTGNSAGAGGGGGSGTTKPQTPTTPTEPETPKVEEKTFADLGNHAWAEDAINALAKDGIIKGTSSTTFSPAANITRADFAILLVRAFELESDSTENFADVADSDYFAKELAIARNNGIINGVGDNKYAPRNTITRQDMMTIVYRAMVKLGIELKETTDVEMPDADSVASYAKEAVNALIGAGLVNGKSGKIAPTDYTTRAEVAVLLKRILDYAK